MPVPLAPDPGDAAGIAQLIGTLPADLLAAAGRVSHFIAESPRSARAFLKAVAPERVLRDIAITEIAPRGTRGHDQSGQGHAPHALLAPALAGHDVALVSESGAPGVADPGAAVVRAAHALGVPVVPLVGPSALLLALMASGGTGQRFTFHGYLPVEADALAQALRALEEAAWTQDATQLWIETPYRTPRTLEAVLAHCADDTWLAVASDLTLADERVRAATVAGWRDDAAARGLGPRLAVFALAAPAGISAARPTPRPAQAASAPDAPSPSGRAADPGAPATRRPPRPAASPGARPGSPDACSRRRRSGR